MLMCLVIVEDEVAHIYPGQVPMLDLTITTILKHHNMERGTIMIEYKGQKHILDVVDGTVPRSMLEFTLDIVIPKREILFDGVIINE